MSTPTAEKLSAELHGLYAQIVAESFAAGPRDEDHGWRPAFAAARRKKAEDWTEDDLAAARSASRNLFDSNPFAIGGGENRVNYAVDDGLTYGVVPAKGVDKNADVVVQAGEFLDAFLELNNLPEIEAETVMRMDRDGEAFLRLFAADGIPEVRFVEPENVAAPDAAEADLAGVRMGVRFKVGDTKTVLGYFVVEDDDAEPMEVPEQEIVHLKLNTDSSKPRGRPTFYPVDELLRSCADLWKAMSTTAKARAKIAIVWEVAKLNNQVEQDMERRLKQGTQTTADGQQIPVSTEVLPFGTVIRHGAGDKLNFPSADVAAADSVEVLEAGLRGAASLVNMPTWMFSGKADEKYANAFVGEAPALRAFRKLQRRLKEKFGEGRLKTQASLVWRAFRLGVQAKVLPPEVLTAVRITCTAPALEVRDKAAEASTNATYIGLGVKSVETTQEEVGLDPETERKRGATAFAKLTGFTTDGKPVTNPIDAATMPAAAATVGKPDSAGTGQAGSDSPGTGILATVGGNANLI